MGCSDYSKAYVSDDRNGLWVVMVKRVVVVMVAATVGMAGAVLGAVMVGLCGGGGGGSG